MDNDGANDQDWTPEEIERMEQEELAQKPWLRGAPPLKPSPPGPVVPPASPAPPLPPLRQFARVVPVDRMESQDRPAVAAGDVPPAPLLKQKRTHRQPAVNRRLLEKGPLGETPVVRGRPLADGTSARVVSVQANLTEYEARKLDRFRGWVSRADSLARMGGIRFDGYRGAREPIGATGLVLEREDGCFRVLDGNDVVVAEIPIAAWIEAVLVVSKWAGDR